jgi:hypothetical protein
LGQGLHILEDYLAMQEQQEQEQQEQEQQVVHEGKLRDEEQEQQVVHEGKLRDEKEEEQGPVLLSHYFQDVTILSGEGKLPASNRYSRESFQTWRNFLGQRFAKKKHARLPIGLVEELSSARSLDDIARIMDDHNIVLRKKGRGRHLW